MRLGLRLWVKNYLDVEDLKVQITIHQPPQQGDDDDEEISSQDGNGDWG